MESIDYAGLIGVPAWSKRRESPREGRLNRPMASGVHHERQPPDQPTEVLLQTSGPDRDGSQVAA